MLSQSVTYDINLHISYTYDNCADSSRQIIRLMPLDLPNAQHLITGSHFVSPKADIWIERIDFYGNHYVELAFFQTHQKIDFKVKARVKRFIPQSLMISALNMASLTPNMASLTPNMASLESQINDSCSLEPWAPHHFLHPSPRVPIDVLTTIYAASLADHSADIVEIVGRIGSQLHQDMKYDPEATTVDTPMLEAFNARHGVCQDFAHIMIACLRGVGIPAAYVSGFLCTKPPPGKPRLEGVDAMHAWVQAWCGQDIGWVEYDPTNGIFAGIDHITVARGRDYSEVAPIKGIMRSYGNHSTKQAVDVMPVDDD